MDRRLDANRIPSGALLQLDELGSADAGRTVRVLGRITRIDENARTLVLEYRGTALTVETALLEGSPVLLRRGDFRHFLGLLHMTDARLVLRARLVIDMDGVDCDLYDRCLILRRNLERRLFGSHASR
eukprot:IDg8259t1